MNNVRHHVAGLSTRYLRDLFAEFDRYEQTGTLPDEAFLRRLSEELMPDATPYLAIDLVAREVWRELAVRGFTPAEIELHRVDL